MTPILVSPGRLAMAIDMGIARKAKEGSCLGRLALLGLFGRGRSGLQGLLQAGAAFFAVGFEV